MDLRPKRCRTNRKMEIYYQPLENLETQPDPRHSKRFCDGIIPVARFGWYGRPDFMTAREETGGHD